MIKVSISDRFFSSLVSFYTHFWTMIFDLKLVNIKDCVIKTRGTDYSKESLGTTQDAPRDPQGPSERYKMRS